jgi:hypothetical protein
MARCTRGCSLARSSSKRTEKRRASCRSPAFKGRLQKQPFNSEADSGARLCSVSLAALRLHTHTNERKGGDLSFIVAR